MKVKLLVIPIMLFSLFLTACGEIFNQDSQVELSSKDSQVESTNRNSQIEPSDTSFLEEDDKALSMDKLIFSYFAYYPKDKNVTCDYFLFVRSNGSIYSGVDTNFYAKNFEFQKQLYNFNNVDFELLDAVNHLGNLSDVETETLCSLIANVDIESEAYRRNESELMPSVVDTASYAFYCYPTDNKKTAFYVASMGNCTGASYRTYDENALRALEIIYNNALIAEWEEGCSKENNVVLTLPD